MSQYKADCIRVTHPCAGRHQTILLLFMLPLDLHVLSLPLAFILSQDQTLHCKWIVVSWLKQNLPICCCIISKNFLFHFCVLKPLFGLGRQMYCFWFLNSKFIFQNFEFFFLCSPLTVFPFVSVGSAKVYHLLSSNQIMLKTLFDFSCQFRFCLSKNVVVF